MEKLKTLKDFITKPIYLDFDRKLTTSDAKNLAYCGGCGGDFLEVGCHCDSVNWKKVKQEAIKWVKSDCTINHNHWICSFLNITKEDLQ